MSSESSNQQATEISDESGQQILSLLQVQGDEGSGHETIQLVTTSGDGEDIDGQESLLLQPAIEVNGERHVILQQAQDPNTGEVLVFLQGENGETVCLPPEALNANIVQMDDGSGQVYTLALPSEDSSVMVVSESDGTIVEGGATLMTEENFTATTTPSASDTQVVQSVVGPLMATTSTEPTESITTSESDIIESTNLIESEEASTSTSTSVPITTTSTATIAATISTTTTTSTTSNFSEAEASAIASIVEGINSMSNCDDINSKLSEAVSKLHEDDKEDIIISDKSEITVDGNNMNYGSAVIQVQDANSTTSLDSLVANAMLAAGESNYVIMTTGEDGELPKEINLADVINAGSASGQTIFLQTSEGLVACQAATTGEDGSLQIVADGSGNAIAVSSSSNLTPSSFSETTLAYTLSSTSSGIELTPVTNVVSAVNSSNTSNRNNQVTSVSSRSRLSRQPKPRSSLSQVSSFSTSTLSSSSQSSASASASTTTSTLSSSLSSSVAAAATSTTIGETLLLPSKHLDSSTSLSIQTSDLNSSSNSSLNNNININTFTNSNTNSRRRTLTSRGRSNISVSITPSSSLSTTSSSPIIPVQPDAIHSSSSDFSTLAKSSASETTDSSILTEGVSKPSQLAASRRTYSKKNNIVWLNPETTSLTKRANSSTSSSSTTTLTAAATTTTTTTTKEIEIETKIISDSGDNLNDENIDENGLMNLDDNVTTSDLNMIDLPVDSADDTTLTTNSEMTISPTSSSTLTTTTPATTTCATSTFSSSKLIVKPPIVSNVPTFRSIKKVSEPIVISDNNDNDNDNNNDNDTLDNNNSTTTPLSPSKSSVVSKDYSRVISSNDKSLSTSGVPSMIKVGAVPQLGRVVTSPVKITSPVKPNSPVKVTTTTTTLTTTNTTTTTTTTASTTTTTSSSCIPPPKKRVNIALAQLNDENDLFATPLSPVKSPKKDENLTLSTITNSNSNSNSNSDDNVSASATTPSEESVLETPVLETRSTRSSSKRKSESEVESAPVREDIVTPSKKKVNFALDQFSDDNDLFVAPSSPVKSPKKDDNSTKETLSTSFGVSATATATVTASDTPNTITETRSTRSSRKRKAETEIEIETCSSADESSIREDILSADLVTPSKKTVTIGSAQSNDDNNLFAAPSSPVKSPKRDIDNAMSQGPSEGSNLDTPVSETRSTRSSRKRKSDTEIETSSSADESSIREDVFSSDFVTPSKKRVNFAPGTSIEVIRDEENEDGDGDDDDSESTSFMGEKRKEKRLSGRKRTPVNRPSMESPSKSLSSPQPILKMSKRVVDSGPLLMHFGSDSNDNDDDVDEDVDVDVDVGVGVGVGVDDGESDSIGKRRVILGIDDSEGRTMKGLLESRGPSEFFDFTINGCCFHIRHQSGRLSAFSPNESDGNYACLNNCGYRTSRMNNIILHNKDQCTVIKMQWQSEYQHLINRQRLMNQDDSTPSTASTPSTPTTPTPTTTITITEATDNNNDSECTTVATTSSSSPIKSPTITINEEGIVSPTQSSSSSPNYETPLASPQEKEAIPETLSSETEAVEVTETETERETTKTTEIENETETETESTTVEETTSQ